MSPEALEELCKQWRDDLVTAEEVLEYIERAVKAQLAQNQAAQ